MYIEKSLLKMLENEDSAISIIENCSDEVERRRWKNRSPEFIEERLEICRKIKAEQEERLEKTRREIKNYFIELMNID